MIDWFIDWLIDRLIDWFVFYAVLAMVQSYNGGLSKGVYPLNAWWIFLPEYSIELSTDRHCFLNMIDIYTYIYIVTWV